VSTRRADRRRGRSSRQHEHARSRSGGAASSPASGALDTLSRTPSQRRPYDNPQPRRPAEKGAAP
jgi:hypothetical protein